MKNLILLAVILAVAPATSVLADAPPAHGNYHLGWGMNPTNWNSYTGNWTSPLALYNPLGPHGGGGNWVVGYDGNYDPLYIDYADITLELWIEMSMIQFYQNTSYKWHRLGRGGETITFVIQGWTKSNEGCWVSLIGGSEAIDSLHFQHNIGVGDDRNMRATIPIAWRGRWGDGLVYGNNIQLHWTALTVTGNDIDLAELNATECWYEFEGSFTLVDYEADGYYNLVMDGCPSPGL